MSMFKHSLLPDTTPFPVWPQTTEFSKILFLTLFSLDEIFSTTPKSTGDNLVLRLESEGGDRTVLSDWSLNL